MAKVIIYHAVEGTRFREFGPDTILEKVYGYEGDGDPEVVWRLNNVVDGREWPTIFQTRSLSVGDVIEVDGKFMAVESFGWKHLDADQVAGQLRQRPTSEQIAAAVARGKAALEWADEYAPRSMT